MTLDGLVNKVNGFKNNVLTVWNTYKDRGLLDEVEDNPHKNNTPRALKRYGDDHVDSRINNYLERHIKYFEKEYKRTSEAIPFWEGDLRQCNDTRNSNYSKINDNIIKLKKEADKYKAAYLLFKELDEILKRDGRDAFLGAKSEKYERIRYLLKSTKK